MDVVLRSGCGSFFSCWVPLFEFGNTEIYVWHPIFRHTQMSVKLHGEPQWPFQNDRGVGYPQERPTYVLSKNRSPPNWMADTTQMMSTISGFNDDMPIGSLCLFKAYVVQVGILNLATPLHLLMDSQEGVVQVGGTHPPCTYCFFTHFTIYRAVG